MASRGLGITPPSRVSARHSRVHADPMGRGAAAVECERPPAQAPPPPARNAGAGRTGAGAAWPSGGSSRRDSRRDSGRDSRRDSGSGETCQHSPVRRCVDTYAHCTSLQRASLLRVPASCVPYVPEVTRGTLPRGSTYCSIPAAIRVTACGRAVRAAYRVLLCTTQVRRRPRRDSTGNDTLFSIDTHIQHVPMLAQESNAPPAPPSHPPAY